MQPILHLIRYKNLLIIALTMVLMRYGIIQPILVAYGLSLELSIIQFSLLVFATILTAAGGYIINDYFDIQIDSVNKPGKNTVNNHFSRKWIMQAYLYVNIIAVLIALYLLILTNSATLFFIFPLVIGALWFYSTKYKRQGFIGNMIVSVLCGLVPIIPALYEIIMVNGKYRQYITDSNLDLSIVIAWTGAFSLFAFLLSFSREVVKDAEDISGDRAGFRKTIPIALGEVFTKLLVNSILLIVVFLILFLFYKYLKITNNGSFDYVTFFYFILLLIIPLIITGGIIFNASTKKHFHLASTLLKIVMFTGICFAIVVRYKII